MNHPDDRKYDTRQLEKNRARHWQDPGEPRLHHLDGLSGPYVLSEWHIFVGERIDAFNSIATIETDSFTLELETFDSGVVTELCFAVGDSNSRRGGCSPHRGREGEYRFIST